MRKTRGEGANTNPARPKGRRDWLTSLDTLRRSRPRHATVRIRSFVALPAALRALGADPDAVLRAAGIEPAIFADPDNVLPYAALGRLVGAGVEATGCEAFGLMVCARQGATATGLSGLVSLHAPTVREALRVLAEGLKTSDTGGAVAFAERGGEASLGYVVTAPDIELSDQIVDGAMAIAFNTMRQLCGPAWRPREVRLARKAPRDKSPFLRLFEAPVAFGATAACLVFDAAALDAPVRGRNADYAEILAPLYAVALASAPGDFASTVRSLIRVKLGAGSLSRDDVCRALGLSPRTFVHRLEAHGLTYTGLADEAKFEAAQGLLRKGETISETAARLGFADQSAFTRAFKAWSGATPARWRSERSVRSDALQKLLGGPDC